MPVTWDPNMRHRDEAVSSGNPLISICSESYLIEGKPHCPQFTGRATSGVSQGTAPSRVTSK